MCDDDEGCDEGWVVGGWAEDVSEEAAVVLVEDEGTAVGVTGVVEVSFSLVGDEGESMLRSREPDESFVRFFFKNPKDGIEAVNCREEEGSLPWLWPA